MISWEEKRRRIIENYPKFPTDVLARAVDVPIEKVRHIAIHYKLKKDYAALEIYRKYQPDETRDAILSEYPMVPTNEIAKKYGWKVWKVQKTAEYYGVKKDYVAMRAYLDSRLPDRSNVVTNKDEEQLWECIYADYPNYTNKELSKIYGKPRTTIAGRAHKLGLKKDMASRKSVLKRQVEAYPTRPTREIAKDIGCQEQTVRRRANRYGLRKLTPWKNTRRPSEPPFKYRMVLALADTYTVKSIAEKVGYSADYVRQIIKKSGLTPITEPKPVKNIIQWTLDGQIVARYPSCRAAARAIGGRCSFGNIWSCVKGKTMHKTAYGFRWTEEIINP